MLYFVFSSVEERHEETESPSWMMSVCCEPIRSKHQHVCCRRARTRRRLSQNGGQYSDSELLVASAATELSQV